MTIKQARNVLSWGMIGTLTFKSVVVIKGQFKRKPLKKHKAGAVFTLLCFLCSLCLEWSGAERFVCLPSSRLRASAIASSNCPCRGRRTRGGEGDRERVHCLDSTSAVPETNTFYNSIQTFKIIKFIIFVFVYVLLNQLAKLISMHLWN